MSQELTEKKPPYRPGERSITDIIADLSKPISDRHLKTKRQGGTDLTFIPWYHAIRYLDLYAPGWSYTVETTSVPAGNTVFYKGKALTAKQLRELKLVANDELLFIPSSAVAVVAELIIPCSEGVVSRKATGQEDAEVTGFGDSTSNSESMALRRAAAKFGLGLYLYDK